MRRNAPIRWIEEAEARRMWLYDAEAKPAAAQTSARPEFLLVRRTTLTVLVSRMTERIARAARGQPSVGDKEDPAERCDHDTRSWIAVGCGGMPYRTAVTASALAEGAEYASSYSRETSLSV
jgi:hypothetical protein